MGRPIINYANQKFGRLTVIERDLTKPKGTGKPAYWICKCDCGNVVSVRNDKLKNNETKSCGCFSKEVRTQIFLIDLTNKKFGNLFVLNRDLTKPTGKNKPAYWNCRCDCGNIVSVRSDHLRNGSTQSCGCLNSCGELKITRILTANKINYKTQYEFDDLKGDFNKLRFDFAVFEKEKLSYLIEYQGKQHYSKWGNESEERFLKRLKYDQLKREYCAKNNIKLIEIPYTDFLLLDFNYIEMRVKHK